MVLALLVGQILTTGTHVENGREPLSLEARRRVVPILDAVRAERQNDDKPWHPRSEEALAALHQDPTPSADEAMAALLWFYIGEATSEDLEHEITIRGKRMLPLLLRYRARAPDVVDVYPFSMRLDDRVRRDSFRRLITAIRKRRVVGEP